MKLLSDAIPDTPVLLYNNSGLVGCSMSTELICALARKVPNIAGMKDTSGDMTLTGDTAVMSGGSTYMIRIGTAE